MEASIVEKRDNGFVSVTIAPPDGLNFTRTDRRVLLDKLIMALDMWQGAPGVYRIINDKWVRMLFMFCLFLITC
jgi:hypothetical protein